MAKKLDKSKESVPKRRNIEQNVNKDVKNESKEMNSNVFTSKYIFKMIFIVYMLFKLLVFTYTVYKAYVYLTNVPDLPILDVDHWWTDSNRSSQDTTIRRFRPMFTKSMNEELHTKFQLHLYNKNKQKSINASWTYGTNSNGLEQIQSYWAYSYSFGERQRFLNKFDHFKTNIQGLDIHFVRVKPNVGEDIKVLPLLMLHGWPSTFRDFYEVIPLLIEPRTGFDFVFEVVVPSLPGFVYSQAATKPGMGPLEVAIIMKNLMERLGFDHYYIHGEDFGHTIGTHMATYFDKTVLGLHTTFPVNFSKISMLTWIVGSIWPSMVGQGLEDKMYPLKERIEFLLEESGYMHLQGTKPDTIGVALTDSPIGLLSYMIDRLLIFTDPQNKYLEDGGIAKYYNLTDIIDNVMLYWTTNSMTTAMRLYRESIFSPWEQIMAEIPSSVPTWGLRTKNELLHQPDFMLRWKYPNLIGTTTLDFGGHFAALERPVDVASDLFLSVQRFLEV